MAEQPSQATPVSPDSKPTLTVDSPAREFQQVVFTFKEGPIGISLGDNRYIGSVHENSQAAAEGVLPGDLLIMVGEQDVSSMVYTDILDTIKASTRPVTLTFLRETFRPSTHGKHSALSAKDAVRKAGAFMKGLLNTSVQIVQAVDKVIDKAIDDSTRQVAHAAKTTAKDLSAVKKRASALSKPIVQQSLEELELEHFEAYCNLQRNKVDKVQKSTTTIIQLVDAVDAASKNAATATKQYAEQAGALDRVIANDIPNLIKQLEASRAEVERLTQVLTNMDTQVADITSARLRRQHEDWAAQQKATITAFKLQQEESVVKAEKAIHESLQAKARSPTAAENSTVLVLHESTAPTTEETAAETSVQAPVEGDSTGVGADNTVSEPVDDKISAPSLPVTTPDAADVIKKEEEDLNVTSAVPDVADVIKKEEEDLNVTSAVPDVAVGGAGEKPEGETGGKKKGKKGKGKS